MSSLDDAIRGLAGIRIVVSRVDEPWLDLYDVSGHGELTRLQVVSLALQKGVL